MLAVKQHLERLRAPGYQYVWTSADAVLERVVGGAARLPNEPMTARTTLNAYSVAKTLTAAAVLKLASQGALDLDAPVASYLDIALPYAERPTVRQTLAHTGGFPNPLPLSWVHLVDEHAQFDRAAFVARVLRDNPKLKAAPGHAFAYSNVGYLLLGEVVRRVSGRDYVSFVEQELVRPLALTEDSVLGFAIPDPRLHAHGHVRRFGLLDFLVGPFVGRKRFVGAAVGRWVEMSQHYANGAAYGGLIANALGLACYLRGLLLGECGLNPAARRLLFEPARLSSGAEIGRSLGWVRGQAHGQSYFAHAGGGAAYYCEARLYPAIGRASVVMLNRAGLSHARLLDSLDRSFLSG
jgi:D-alanyl-D-alanine carboxypeptidase